MHCGEGMGHGDRCHVMVLDEFLQKKKEIDWNATTCSRKKQNLEQGEHKNTDQVDNKSMINSPYLRGWLPFEVDMRDCGEWCTETIMCNARTTSNTSRPTNQQHCPSGEAKVCPDWWWVGTLYYVELTALFYSGLFQHHGGGLLPR